MTIPLPYHSIPLITLPTPSANPIYDMARGRRRLEKRPKQADAHQTITALGVYRPTSLPLQQLRGLNRSNLKVIPTPEDGLPFSLLDAAKCPDTCQIQYNSGLRMVEMVVTHSERLHEANLIKTYEYGLWTARAHAGIAEVATRANAFMIEAMWTRLKDRHKRKLWLAAMYSGVQMHLSSGYRTSAPEFNVDLFCANGGRYFIDLLQHIVRSGIECKRTDTYYPVKSTSGLYEKYASFEAPNSRLPYSRAQRLTLLESHHCWFDKVRCVRAAAPHVAAVDGALPLELADCSTYSTSSRELAEAMDEPLQEDFMRKSLEDLEAEKAVYREHCRCCMRFVEQVPELVAERRGLLHCSKCLKIDPPRKVGYCSTACQLYDWKFGDHQVHCGLLFADAGLPFHILVPAPETPPLSVSLQSILIQIESNFTDLHAPPIPPRYPYRTPKVNMTDDDGNLIVHPIAEVISTNQDLGRLFLEAVRSREVVDIRRFVVASGPLLVDEELVTSNSLPKMLASDWDLSEEMMSEWLNEGVSVDC
ncbi:hypothetical protein JCM5353_002318 [Sporobolomyces roseus]